MHLNLAVPEQVFDRFLGCLSMFGVMNDQSGYFVHEFRVGEIGVGFQLLLNALNLDSLVKMRFLKP